MSYTSFTSEDQVTNDEACRQNHTLYIGSRMAVSTVLQYLTFHAT